MIPPVLVCFRALIAGCLLIVAGCGGDARKLPAANAQVHGKATVDGTAVPAGTVVFFEATSGGVMCQGEVDSKGEYLMNFANKPKIPSGKYKVFLTEKAAIAARDVSSPDYAKMMMANTTNPTVAPPASAIPSKYASSLSSGWEFNVIDGDQTIDLAMTKDAK